MRSLIKPLFVLLAIATLHPAVPSAGGLVLGIAFALFIGNPFPEVCKNWTSRLLQISVMCLGGAMNLHVIAQVGMHGIGYTALGLILTLAFGLLLGRLLDIHRDTSLLVSCGTAICGGSAIAAVTSVIQPKPAATSVSLAIVFLLNALALVIFPWLGHAFSLTEAQFGLWSALAIHDTSSVVGASMQYGPQALEIATTVKLTRSLWIIPLIFAIAFSRRGTVGKVNCPWFILGFVAIAAAVTWLPEYQHIGNAAASVGR